MLGNNRIPRNTITARLLLLGYMVLIGAGSQAYAATTGGIQGNVRGSDGKPLGGVHVTVTETGLDAKTDAKGSFTLLGVQPGTYTLSAASPLFTATSTKITVQQDVTTDVDFSLEKKTITTGASKISAAGVRRNDTSTQYTLTPGIEQQTKSQPNNLYQFPGLLFGQPGITPDPSGYTHIRGSDLNQVGYSIDGVPTRDPLTNQFATDIVTVGLKSANLYPGTADPSYGNATGGFINEVTQNGRDLRGGTAEGTFGPFNGWNYLGTNDQFGNVTPDGKFDYYLSSIMFANDFPGNTQTSKLTGSYDGLGKINYYADANDTFTGFYNQGFEGYDYFDPVGPGSTFKFNPTGTGASQTSQDTGVYQQDHLDQNYSFGYFTAKHSFSPSSFLTYRIYDLSAQATFHTENVGGEWEMRNTQTIGNQLDYTNQVTESYQLRAGLWYIPGTTFYHSVQSPTGPPLQPITAIAPSGDNDRYSEVQPTQTVAYVGNKIKLDKDRATIDAGVRLASMHYGLVKFSSFTDEYADPRLGASYSPSRDLVFRTSFGVNSQFPDSQYTEILFPEDIGMPATAIDPAAQEQRLLSEYRQYNPLGPEHSENIDLGVEKSFEAAGSSWSANLTGFDRHQYDLIQLEFSSLSPPGGQRYYDNAGHGHASGAEFILTKKKKKTSDWYGFLSYTNQVATATNSFFDTGYLPYFFSAFAGDTSFTNAQFQQYDNSEYPVSYDQRHTIALVATKRFTHLLESSIIVDAGSGFPYVNSLDSIGEGVDSQHTEQTVGDADFSEVPITLRDQSTLQPLNPLIARTGWHYKLSLNTNFYLSERSNLFLNIDNILNADTVLNYATTTQAGTPYYLPPTPQYPQGRVYYGASAVLDPIFVSFGIRTKF